MANGNLFLGGVPTEPQVRALNKAFGDRGPGDVISYEEIRQAINVDPKSSRFRTVVAAWRKRLRKERNIVTVCIAGAQEVRMLRDDERASDAFRDARRSIKGLGKATAKAADIPVERLAEPQRNTATHLRRILEGAAASARAASNELAVTFAPPKQLPRARASG